MNRLKRKLAGLYTASGIAVLSVILLAFGFISYEGKNWDVMNAMEEQGGRYLDMLENQNHIEDSFLETEERYSECAIFLFDGKNALRFPGEYLKGAEREELLFLCLEAGSQNWIRLKSGGDRYLVYSTESRNGEKSLYLCKSMNQFYKELFLPFGILLCCFLGGSAVLFGMGRLLAGQAIKPVEENQKEQMAFVHGAGHELRSPLAVIRSNNAAAGVDQERTEHYRQIIDDECRRMGRLVEELLVLASGQTKGYDIREELFLADTFIIECYEKFEPVCREGGGRLSVFLPDDKGVEIKGDKQRLEQVVGIFIQNAVSYGDVEKGIELGLKESRKHIVISVKDHGPGVLPGEREDIFRRFYRTDKSRKDKEHFGLGLSIAKELIDAMGGRIEVADTPGGGADFRIRLNKN